MKAVRFCILAILTLCSPGLAEAQGEQSVENLVKEFETTKVFWRQFEVAKKLVASGDKSALPALESWLSNEDRHTRCVAAFVFAGLGNEQGLEIISAVIKDKSDRPEGQGVSTAPWSIQRQIRSDRYFAVHVFGALKDKRAVPILIPLLQDDQINYNAAWALGEIGDEQAIGPLIEALGDKNSDVRVIAIQSLEKLRAGDALPHLHSLLTDHEKTHFGDQISVAEAAKTAIATLETKR
ncbi:MAG TPA: HEAT repeat domain-containing protein [Blastocatellia bacterium]|nr:HEAT repeat domain-containing protein [Blastocatellia bacterium]